MFVTKLALEISEQSLEGGILLNMRNLFMMQAVERGEQFVVCTACLCPMGYPKPIYSIFCITGSILPEDKLV